MKKLAAALAVSAVLISGLQPAGAGPTQGGFASDNVEFVKEVPFDVGTATGAKVIGKYLYVTSWRAFSIYDVSDPLDPQLMSTTPFGFKFENEDVDGNDKIMIFSEELPVASVHIWDVEDKSNPVELAVLGGAGQHTMSCLQNCKWLYGSDGNIVDLRDPTKPKLLPNKWTDGMPVTNAHDVNEIAPGRVLTSSDPMMLMDTKNPLKPKLLAVAEPMGEFIHSSKWPQEGRDRFALSTGETWLPGADISCDGTSGGFSTWDASKWKKTKTLTRIETYRPPSGTYADGNPPSGTTFGCSTHWFEPHPDFRNGGIVGVTMFNHGSHFLGVDKKGHITDEGYFLPHAGISAAVYWMTDEIVYSVDLQKGFDVLKWHGFQK